MIQTYPCGLDGKTVLVKDDEVGVCPRAEAALGGLDAEGGGRVEGGGLQTLNQAASEQGIKNKDLNCMVTTTGKTCRRCKKQIYLQTFTIPCLHFS